MAKAAPLPPDHALLCVCVCVCVRVCVRVCVMCVCVVVHAHMCVCVCCVCLCRLGCSHPLTSSSDAFTCGSAPQGFVQLNAWKAPDLDESNVTDPLAGKQRVNGPGGVTISNSIALTHPALIVFQEGPLHMRLRARNGPRATLAIGESSVI